MEGRRLVCKMGVQHERPSGTRERREKAIVYEGPC